MLSSSKCVLARSARKLVRTAVSAPQAAIVFLAAAGTVRVAILESAQMLLLAGLLHSSFWPSSSVFLWSCSVWPAAVAFASAFSVVADNRSRPDVSAVTAADTGMAPPLPPRNRWSTPSNSLKHPRRATKLLGTPHPLRTRNLTNTSSNPATTRIIRQSPLRGMGAAPHPRLRRATQLSLRHRLQLTRPSSLGIYLLPRLQLGILLHRRRRRGTRRRWTSGSNDESCLLNKMDDVVWEVIGKGKGQCSYKQRAHPNTFCTNEMNLTGQCARKFCPLANSRYATILYRKGKVILCMKTIERAHTPAKLWEKVELDANYLKALG